MTRRPDDLTAAARRRQEFPGCHIRLDAFSAPKQVSRSFLTRGLLVSVPWSRPVSSNGTENRRKPVGLELLQR
jgi:hypothetical protein